MYSLNQTKTEAEPTALLIGQLLLDAGIISAEDLKKALALQEKTLGRLGASLLRIGAVSEENLLMVLSDQLKTPVLQESDLPEVADALQFMRGSPISIDWFLSHEVFVWKCGEGEIGCAARDTLDPAITETLDRFFTGFEKQYFLISSYVYEQFAGAISREDRVDALFSNAEDAKYLRELAEEAPVIELVNNVLARAVDAEASDIHIEPQETVFKIRFRIDGVLRDQFVQPIERYSAVASRVKLVSGLDIAERRLPQDGRVTSRISGEDMDLRVSTLPSVHGESVVMRLLPKNRESLTLDRLGLEIDHFELLTDWAKGNGGIVLVTGPTGSGKSTTLHASLTATNDGIRKIITVEDPVEIQVDGITQIQVHADIGLTFAASLRSILRQDPDVIMIGEIRDLETAEIAIQSALSGHLVLSTLHTNDALSSFTRLIDMGVEPFLVAAPLKGVQAQRLVRRLCTNCMQPVDPSDEILQLIEALPTALLGDQWMKPTGCEKCHETGYRGRQGVYQVVPVDEQLQDMIIKGASLADMKSYAEGNGYRSLLQDGLLKASRGETSIEELMRVITSDQTL